MFLTLSTFIYVKFGNATMWKTVYIVLFLWLCQRKLSLQFVTDPTTGNSQRCYCYYTFKHPCVISRLRTHLGWTVELPGSAVGVHLSTSWVLRQEVINIILFIIERFHYKTPTMDGYFNPFCFHSFAGFSRLPEKIKTNWLIHLLFSVF